MIMIRSNNLCYVCGGLGKKKPLKLPGIKFKSIKGLWQDTSSVSSDEQPNLKNSLAGF